jgi:hypothetical protein
MSEISFLKKNRKRRNKLEVFQESLCFESILPIATILNLVGKVEEWVNFKTVLAMNFMKLVHTSLFRSVVHGT